MTDRPAIFVSATSGEFRSFRLAVKWQLERKGVLMIVQDQFPPITVRCARCLPSRIRESDAVICLVGFGYGAEPQQRPADGRRRSYTQLEYDLACELGKPLYVFLSDEQHRPCDGVPNEDTERRQLQLDHRARSSGRRSTLAFLCRSPATPATRRQDSSFLGLAAQAVVGSIQPSAPNICSDVKKNWRVSIPRG